jgi:anti-anti-sigma factor
MATLPHQSDADADAAKHAFAAWLAELRIQAGAPSYAEIRRRMRKFDVDIPTSTLGDGLTGRRMLSMERAVAVVRACGGDPGLQAECRNRWMLARKGTVAVWPDESPCDTTSDPARAATLLLGHDTQCTVERHGNWRILRWSGDWDFHSVQKLRPHLEEALSDPAQPHLIIDLSATTFLDSGSLGGLIYVLKTLHLRGAVLRLVVGVRADNLSAVGRILIITGTCSVLPAYATLDEALTPVSALARRPPQPGPGIATLPRRCYHGDGCTCSALATPPPIASIAN